ncbi:MAG: transcription-repair coupling factor [Bdellovibrionales bacterium]|nr:transcription-repair coupling factor [Bdellovibrionales bacterium]
MVAASPNRQTESLQSLRYLGLGSGATALQVLDLASTSGGGPVLVVVENSRAGELFLSDARFLAPPQHQVIPLFGWEVLPFDGLSPAPDVSAARLYALYELTRGSAAIVVASVEAMMQRIAPPNFLRQSVLELAVGAELDREELIEKLDEGGYRRSTLVEETGQMAIRGAVVDLFPPGSVYPVRVELFGDEVQSIRRFDSSTQRSHDQVTRFSVLPVRELFVSSDRDAMLNALRDRASELSLPRAASKTVEDALQTGVAWPGIEHLQPLLLEQLATVWDYLPPGAPVVVIDEAGVERSADEFQALVEERRHRAHEEGRLFPPAEAAFDSADRFVESARSRMTHAFNAMELLSSAATEPPVAERDASQGNKRFATNETLRGALRAARQSERPLQPLAEALTRRIADGESVAISVSQEQRGVRVRELLEPYEVPVDTFHGSFSEWRQATCAKERLPDVALLTGTISEGFRLPEERWGIISEREIFPDLPVRRAAPAARSVRRFLSSVAQLAEDDYVVHLDYGIGIYRGLKQLRVEGKIGDFLELEYAAEAKLYVPVENIGKVQKYSAVEGKQPALTKLGGKTWEKTKSKVRENVAHLAGQLVQVMAEREMAPGFSFGPVNTYDLDFGSSFPFEETPDQLAAIEATLEDMARERPMDRLVCGDVGYGKTEVAMRAAFKAATAGKQAAVLVPTTVLADQHYASFRERFEHTGVAIGCVSRFFSAAENKATLARLAEGKIDVIIGTHRLLQRDVQFKDLGLLIIDEEHRFGVAHKEKFKRLRADVDVLTLTATPIPRTLHMSLSGIRDLSLIATAPVNRQVIRTYLAPYEANIVREAVVRELSRGGQVFYIYNRVGTIQQVADEVADLVPEARVLVGHGQMKERELESVMHRFIKHEADVLISTTIVESGLDIPNANTIIIRNADMFGLAELYQLRGRVGRSSRRAYAYLLVSDPKALKAEARQRLAVLQSLDDLGEGFRLALQDMEIRGAGNLLGKDQSGHISLVGYELYSRILKEAVAEIKAQRERGSGQAATRPRIDPELHVGFPAHIPPFYIPDVAERLLLYQRLIEVSGEVEGNEILAEIEDRFGNPPDEVYLLIDLMVLRAFARDAGIVRLNFRGGRLSFSFHQDVKLDVEALKAAVRRSHGRLKVSPSGVVSWELDERAVERPLELRRELERLLGDFGSR